jgi:hypothetical protein
MSTYPFGLDGKNLRKCAALRQTELAARTSGSLVGTGAAARLWLWSPTRVHPAIVTSAYLDHIAPEHVVAVIRDREWELPDRW